LEFPWGSVSLGSGVMGDWGGRLGGEGRAGLGRGKGRGGFFFWDDVILGNFKRGKKGERGV
jgi:hypothetical protein